MEENFKIIYAFISLLNYMTYNIQLYRLSSGILDTFCKKAKEILKSLKFNIYNVCYTICAIQCTLVLN